MTGAQVFPMKPPLSSFLALACGFAAVHAADIPLPALESRGAATQLIVDGQPYLILGGEIANTASSSLPYMETVWPKLARLNLNTVLVAVAWAWVEPAEGKFDFSLVDGLLAGARQPTDLENLPLAKGYVVLRDLAPLILCALCDRHAVAIGRRGAHYRPGTTHRGHWTGRTR